MRKVLETGARRVLTQRVQDARATERGRPRHSTHHPLFVRAVDHHGGRGLAPRDTTDVPGSRGAPGAPPSPLHSRGVMRASEGSSRSFSFRHCHMFFLDS